MSKLVKKQTHMLQNGDVIYFVYRKSEPEHSELLLGLNLKFEKKIPRFHAVYFFPRHRLCIPLHQNRAAALPGNLWWADRRFSLMLVSCCCRGSWLTLWPLSVQKTHMHPTIVWALSRLQRGFSLWSPWCSQKHLVISDRKTLSPPPQVPAFASGATLGPALTFPVGSASWFLSAVENNVSLFGIQHDIMKVNRFQGYW